MDSNVIYFVSAETIRMGTKVVPFHGGDIVINVIETIKAGEVAMTRRSGCSSHGLDVLLAPATPICQQVIELNGRGLRGLAKACLLACHLQPLVHRAA